MRLSKSKVLTYESCPLKYKFQYVDGIKTGQTPEAFVKGNAVHKLAENFYQVGKELHECVQEIKQTDEYKKYPESAEKFLKFALRTKTFPLYREVKIYDEELNIAGVIDRIDLYKDKIILIDYKTGQLKPLGEFRFELALYTYLFEKEHNQKVTHWGIYFIDEDHFVGEGRIQQDVVDAVEKIHNVRKLIKENIDNDNFNKKQSWKCKWCEYKVECEDCQ